MKILFDVKATQSGAKGQQGGGEYAKAVLRGLVARSRPGEIAGFHDPRVPLDDDVARLVDEGAVELKPAADRAALQELLSGGGYDRFFSGVPYLHFGLDMSRQTAVLALHGLRHVEQGITRDAVHYERSAAGVVKWLARLAGGRRYRDWRRGQYQQLVDLRARRLVIVVPSWHTRHSLRQKVNVPEGVEILSLFCPATEVTGHAAPDAGVLARLGVEAGRYLLVVSGGRWIKNTYRGLRAYAEVAAALPPERRLPVVVTGGVPRNVPTGARPYLRDAGFVSSAELAALYDDARALFYPTLNEGFGYPPLEAMARGTPVLSSAASSLTEVCGDAAIYFVPTNDDELRIRLHLALTDDDLLAEYAARGRRRQAEVLARQEKDLERLCRLLLER